MRPPQASAQDVSQRVELGPLAWLQQGRENRGTILHLAELGIRTSRRIRDAVRQTVGAQKFRKLRGLTVRSWVDVQTVAGGLA